MCKARMRREPATGSPCFKPGSDGGRDGIPEEGTGAGEGGSFLEGFEEAVLFPRDRLMEKGSAAAKEEEMARRSKGLDRWKGVLVPVFGGMGDEEISQSEKVA